ncbi:MAG: hypothetical protein ACW99Q_29680 [Candidatus Kariarchaeaceae archaeon]
MIDDPFTWGTNTKDLFENTLYYMTDQQVPVVTSSTTTENTESSSESTQISTVTSSETSSPTSSNTDTIDFIIPIITLPITYILISRKNRLT